MDDRVSVSIVIPFYNVEDYIERTLISIENQEFRDFEVILIDDGSTDSSVQIVESYMSKCSFKSKIIKQTNSGVSVARNTGLLNISGKYVVFVDADDIISPVYLSCMYNHIQKNNTGMAICGFYAFEAENMLDDLIYTEKFELLDSYKVMYRYLIKGLQISIGSFMVETDLLKKFDITFADGFKWDEDNHFIWRVLTHVDRVALDMSPLYYYRMRHGSAMANFDMDRLKGITLYKELEEYLEKYKADFTDTYKKYGVARWVWSLLWQAACALSYTKFRSICSSIKALDWLVKLRQFPDIRVSKSSYLFAYSPFAFYCAARIMARLKHVNRFSA